VVCDVVVTRRERVRINPDDALFVNVMLGQCPTLTRHSGTKVLSLWLPIIRRTRAQKLIGTSSTILTNGQFRTGEPDAELV
jgi:hypothetical protein